MALRLLLVAYYVPPSGGAGVQRPAKWIKYLPACGVEPVVLSVRAGAYPHLDETLVPEVAHAEIVRTGELDPFGIYGAVTGRSRREAVAASSGRVGDSPALAERVARWARANVFVPDARVGWVPFALAAARRMHRRQPVDAVLTTGPPHSVHLVGLRLRRAWGVPWVADFRDPWTEMNYHDELPMTGAVRRLHQRLERRVLRTADAVTTVSPSLARQLDAAGGLPAGTVVTIHNGADEADFAGLDATGAASRAFVLAHVGSLYANRNPTALWQALARLRDRGEIPQLVVRLVGRVGAEVETAARATGVPVERVPYVAHDEAIREMAGAGLLVLSIEPFASLDVERGVTTGKLYEYLASGRPVLGLGPPDGDAAALLDEAGGGSMLARDDVDGLAEVVRQHYAAWAAGAPVDGADLRAVAPYSRRAGAERLARVVRELADGRPAPPGR